MKRLLSIIGAITLLGTSTTSLTACNKKYTEKNSDFKEWKSITVRQDFFIKDYDKKTYLLILNNVLSPNNSWKGRIIDRNTSDLNKLMLEPEWKVYLWQDETKTPYIPNINNTNGEIIDK
ncbi:lipoprotein [Spiroplasma citri]|uniref:lipoprotein n=1 Tax=Spiroplasma citri TaxID=2133 RepID=UPI0013A08924|nr:lipoprotein [Spiroplasma citri]QIA73189.1 lipoprotein [Spiroplasma citri]